MNSHPKLNFDQIPRSLKGAILIEYYHWKNVLPTVFFKLTAVAEDAEFDVCHWCCKLGRLKSPRQTTKIIPMKCFAVRWRNQHSSKIIFVPFANHLNS